MPSSSETSPTILALNSSMESRPYRREPDVSRTAHSASAVLPPRSLLPRQPHTPRSDMHDRPALTAASAFREPSVVTRGSFGFPRSPQMSGGTSMTSFDPKHV